MADNTEATLFTNLESLVVGKVVPLGAAYNPPNPHAEAAAMQANFNAALPLRSALQQKDAAEFLVRHARAELHEPIDTLCTDLINYCKAAGWSANDLNTLRALNRKLRGRPARQKEDDPATPDVNEAAGGISSAQTSYPSRTEHFANVVETLRAKGDFNPTETRFRLSTLDALVQSLRDANSNVSSAKSETDQARAALDAILYLNADNLVDAANSAKFYLKSSFSHVYESVKNMRFRKPARLS